MEHYSVFLFCGLLPWLWIVSSLQESASSITSSGHLITKSMFPAHILPFVTVATNMINFLLSLPLLFVISLVLGRGYSFNLLYLPLLIFIQFILSYGVALVLSSLNVLFRDVQHIVGNVLTFLFFLCPILYPVSQVPDRYQFTLNLNPFSSLIMSYQRILYEDVAPRGFDLLYAGLWAFTLYLVGTIIFARYRENFAELL
jgi:ABC-type polysaccharide/polyol phosphate export permease